MTKPITPKEARQSQGSIPENVFEAFNGCISKHFNGSEARFTQKEVVERICALMNVTTDEVFENKWLDVERQYKMSGWNVEYDGPGYNETYEATFTFRVKQ